MGDAGSSENSAPRSCKRESHAADYDARSEGFVIALNQRDDVALAIDYGKISGVAGGRRAGVDLAVGFGGVDQHGALTGVFLREDSFDRDFGESRVGVVAAEIGVGELHGFNLLMQLGDT